MSVEAITWALKQDAPNSSAKFVLVVMANCANERMECYPSISYLCAATEQDRKTVIANIQRLLECGLIEDTGQRVGATGRVKAYRLRVEIVPKTVQKQTVPKSESFADTKQSQKRTVIVPKTDRNSPKNGTRNRQEPSRNHQGTKILRRGFRSMHGRRCLTSKSSPTGTP